MAELFICSNNHDYIMEIIFGQIKTFVEKNMEREEIQKIIDVFQVCKPSDIATVILSNCYWDVDRRPKIGENWTIMMFSPLVWLSYANVYYETGDHADHFTWMECKCENYDNE